MNATTVIGGVTLNGVEQVTADLLGGVNTLNYAATVGSSVTANLLTGQASGFFSISNIQNVIGSGGNDTLTDGLGNNSLSGGAGNDTLFASVDAAADLFNGGANIDTLDLSLTSAAASVSATLASSLDIGNIGLTAIENVVGSQGDDIITFNGGVNILDGRGGNDNISAGGGNDTLLGGEGDDTLVGGLGADLIDGGEGSDTVNYTFGDGVDTVTDTGAVTDTDTLNITGTDANNVLDVIWDGASLTNFEGGTLAGIENVTAELLGGTIDTLTYAGSTEAVEVDLGLGTASGFSTIAGIERVTGGSGADILTGGLGANLLAGGAGDDTYHVGAGDTVAEGAGNGTDTVFSSAATFTLGANVENLTLEPGAGDINGTGNGLANVIIGNEGANTLNGGGGADTVTGGAGNDIMNGGAGSDTLVFGPGFGQDVVNGFDANPNPEQDFIDISGLGITEDSFAANVVITDLGANTEITFVGLPGHSILLNGVTGVGANSINQDDFILLV